MIRPIKCFPDRTFWQAFIFEKRTNLIKGSRQIVCSFKGSYLIIVSVEVLSSSQANIRVKTEKNVIQHFVIYRSNSSLLNSVSQGISQLYHSINNNFNVQNDNYEFKEHIYIIYYVTHYKQMNIKSEIVLPLNRINESLGHWGLMRYQIKYLYDMLHLLPRYFSFAKIQ
jgi:hypothetical protein